MIGEYSCPYLYNNGELAVGLVCNSKGATFIRNLSKCPQVTYLDETCTALFEALTDEQAAKAQKVINEAFGNCKLDNEQIPRALELIVKVLEEIIQEEEEENIYKSSVMEILDLYYILEVPVDSAKIGLEEGKAGLELLFQKLAAMYDDLVQELAPKEEQKVIQESLGKEVEKDEEIELEVDIDKYGNERNKEDLPKDQFKVVEIGSANEMNMVGPCYEGNGVKKDEKDETKEFEHVGKLVGLRCENSMEEVDYQKSAKMDDSGSTKLEPKEEIIDDKELEESDSITLINEDENNKKKERPLKEEALRHACMK
ncbi:hypothetical protein C2G38_2219464 [Gigaspora rosea]|uniref:Uncharacterized protein n=1 Tax=Gigaspora rosea TaxID=44941 RepID=A0A397U5H8_9GLOM|nr:hypothetical protein C2G38_2219464 [Gigaspora rosea]